MTDLVFHHLYEWSRFLTPLLENALIFAQIVSSEICKLV